MAWEARPGYLSYHRATVTPEAEVIGILVRDTPPRSGGEFQGGLSVALAIRSPEGLPRASPARSPITVDPVTFRLSQEDSYAPPASTALPRLVESEGAQSRSGRLCEDAIRTRLRRNR
jgi:hypothetical protein